MSIADELREWASVEVPYKYGHQLLAIADRIDAEHEKTTKRAIAATLGTGTCEMEYVSDFMSWHCMACDQMDMAPRNPKPRYCKWCGRKVVEE